MIPGWEDPLEKEMATHSSILAWEIPWTKEPGRLQSMGCKSVGYDLATKQQQIYSGRTGTIILGYDHFQLRLYRKMRFKRIFHGNYYTACLRENSLKVILFSPIP